MGAYSATYALVETNDGGLVDSFPSVKRKLSIKASLDESLQSLAQRAVCQIRSVESVRNASDA